MLCDETLPSVSATCPASGHTVANWGLHDVNLLDTTLVVRGRRKITQPGRARGETPTKSLISCPSCDTAFLSAVHDELKAVKLKFGVLNDQVE
jgi:hypothetical protein